MNIRLRAHHLLCMLTFAGEGYTPAFTDNLAAIVARIGAGAAIDLVDGPDDICAPLDASDDRHCDGAQIRRRDRDALRALAGAERPLSPARPLTFDAAAIAELRAQFAAGTIRAACAGCSWQSLCTGIAAAGYTAARL